MAAINKDLSTLVVNRMIFWESNPCRRREREGTYCNSTELSGMDSTLPHLKDSRERLLDL
jgi:hypothetical protein